MNLLYAVLCYAMAALNLYRGVQGGSTMNAVFALLWLGLGIYLTLKYAKEKSGRKE